MSYNRSESESYIGLNILAESFVKIVKIGLRIRITLTAYIDLFKFEKKKRSIYILPIAIRLISRTKISISEFRVVHENTSNFAVE